MQNAPRPDLQPDELSVIRHVVMDFLAARTELPGFEFDDLFQECLLHWWKRRDGYEAGRGASRKTFLRKVVQAKLRDLARGWGARKRGSGERPLSLDTPASRDDPEGPAIGEVISCHEDIGRDIAAAIDLEAVTRRLSTRQRRLIAGAAAGLTRTELSQRLRVSRDTLQEELRRIRQAFREEGLALYLD